MAKETSIMKAQKIYNLRNKFMFCSGTDLHDFFARTVGNPSPSGNTEVSTQLATNFMMESASKQVELGADAAWHTAATRAIASAA